jgi:magnesium-transporting ATPase (P-type)
MRVVSVSTVGGTTTVTPDVAVDGRGDRALDSLAVAAASCNNAALEDGGSVPTGDPTEVALLRAAAAIGADVDARTREARRRGHFHFDPTLKLMSTVDDAGDGLYVYTKGAPEAVLARCRTLMAPDGSEEPLSTATRASIAHTIDEQASHGLRILVIAQRRVDSIPHVRSDAEQSLCFLGAVAMFDPPRAEVPAAVAQCHAAGIRVIVVTGDHPLTATELAHQIGIGAIGLTTVTGADLDEMSEAQLDELLDSGGEIVFARTSPEAKLRIADALRSRGDVVAMTGDGVNDAPALRNADIGVAMGSSGTDVAREAATMILMDDNFATVVSAVEEGRRVYANVRKFIFYIFAHATPEIVPFLVFALSGGAVPLPLTVLAILAIDLGTEIVPALALGREPAEPGLVQDPPRPRTQGVIDAPMLVRAWLFVGLISAALAMAAFLYTLLNAGWSPGDPTGAGSALHHTYLQATTSTFLAIVFCQVGTAFAARTERVSLRSVGVTTNKMLLWGIAFELGFAGAVAYVPALQRIFDTADVSFDVLLLMLPFPLIVWGADEIRRWALRRRVRDDISEAGCADPRSAAYRCARRTGDLQGTTIRDRARPPSRV